MNIAIFYFSGTGNTRKVAKEYAENFEKRGETCTLFELPLKNKPDLANYDLIGIGYPIHSFNAPQPLLQFAKSLQRRKLKSGEEPKRAFIFKTSGEPVKMSRVSSLKLISILKRRNIAVKNEYQYVMPYNMIFRHTDHQAYVMWETAKKLIPIDCNDILSGVKRQEKKMPFGNVLAWFLRIEHGGAHIVGVGYRATKDCTGCGLCAKNCPVDNIKIEDGKPKFGGKCLICARCSFNCPKDCIRIGLLNGWRVHGAYSFKDGDPNEKNGHDNYCKKAYARYFKEAEVRISKHENDGN